MGWTFKVSLLPGEEIIEEGATETRFGVMPEHTPILTNQRVMFKYNTFSTGLVRSFKYANIIEAKLVTRFKIDYLKFSVVGRDYYLKVDDPAGWSAKIAANCARFKDAVTPDASADVLSAAPADAPPSALSDTPSSATPAGSPAPLPTAPPSASPDTPSSAMQDTANRAELLGMLDRLHEEGILNKDELREKRKAVMGLSA